MVLTHIDLIEKLLRYFVLNLWQMLTRETDTTHLNVLSEGEEYGDDGFAAMISMAVWHEHLVFLSLLRLCSDEAHWCKCISSFWKTCGNMHLTISLRPTHVSIRNSHDG